MHSRAAEQIDEWPTRPVGDGGLSDLAASGFTGAVSAADEWLFMLNGHAVGVTGGDVEAFSAGATAREAPAPSLPLLFAMFESDGERRGRYYTEQTSLREVHETLRDGGFTGYVELSENVLSGDYYVAYYGGDPTYAAFLGESNRLETGEAAFDRATDEVGIYTVTAVDVSPLDLPDDAGASAAAAPADAGVDPPDSGAGSGSADPGPSDRRSAPTADDASAPPGESESPAEERRDVARPDRGTEWPEWTADAGGEPAGERPSPDRAAPPAPPTLPDDLTPAVRYVPGAPAPTVSAGANETGAPGDTSVERANRKAGGGGSQSEARRDDYAEESPPNDAADNGQSALDALRERATELDARVERLEATNDRLEAERENLLAERDRLRERVAELQTERAGDDGASAPARDSLSPDEALAGTDLFVRYRAEGDATLDDAHAGADNRDALRENLDVGYHTRFDADATVVDGRPFEEYLADTLERRFVSWLIGDLLYEIRETGRADGLRALYDALPEVDRAELHGEIAGDEGETVRFDVVCRDRLGNPLLCVDGHESREPATGDEMTSLLERAGAIAAAHDSFAGAFLVTESFFDPTALELANERTASGGLLGGGKRASFVELTRKRGYHLGLVEGRNGRFHVTVPEL